MYRITACEVTDFKRLRHARIEPDADAAIILICGQNAAGKTSLLDALSSAFGGAKTLPADPVRHGADEAEIVVELSGGEEPIVIRRIVKPDGESVLELRESGLRVRKPQELLDKIVGSRFLDPLRYLALPPAEQRAKLLEVVAEADRLAELERKRQKAFDRRTEVGRDLRKAEGELERTPVPEIPAAIDVAALTLESQRIDDAMRAIDALGAKTHAAGIAYNAAHQRYLAAEVELTRAQNALDAARLARAEAEVEHENAGIREAELVSNTRIPEGRREAILFELRSAQAANNAVATATAAAKRRQDVIDEVTKLRAEHEKCATAIGEIDQRKAAILAAAALPVPGLGVDDAGVTLNGIPLAQASGAERLRVAPGLAIAASPKLADVWVRDAAILDEDSLAAIAAHAEAAGVRVWLERIARDDGAIVIRDGQVVP